MTTHTPKDVDNILKYNIYTIINTYCYMNGIDFQEYTKGMFNCKIEELEFSNEITELYTKTVMKIRKEIKQKYKKSGFEIGDLEES